MFSVRFISFSLCHLSRIDVDLVITTLSRPDVRKKEQQKGQVSTATLMHSRDNLIESKVIHRETNCARNDEILANISAVISNKEV